MHHPLVVHQIVKDPQNLRNLCVFCLLGVLGNAHPKVHLLLQGLGVELVEEGRLVVLVDVLHLLDVFAQRVPPLVERSGPRIQIDAIKRASIV